MATKIHAAHADGGHRTLGISGSFKKPGWKPNVSMLADVARMTDPYEMKSRIKESWTTMGIVSALILTMTYPQIVSPPLGSGANGQSDWEGDPSFDPVMMSFNILNVISFILALTIDIIIVILMTQLDLCCSPEHTREFLIRFAPINEILSGMFGISIIVLGGQVMSITWFNFNRTINIATMTFWGVAILFVAISATLIATFNRVRVAERGKDIADGKITEVVTGPGSH